VRDFTEGFLMVRTGRASAFFLDDITLSGLVANSKTPSDYVISADPLSVEPYALMMRKDDPRFKNFVDDVLKATFKSGDIAGIYKKWFESPIPPKGINMDVPMSSALKRAIANPTDSTEASAYQ
jgi:glutamate/aspartate transport system substrate-binding protein